MESENILNNLYDMCGDEFDDEFARLQNLVRNGHYPTIYGLFKCAWEYEKQQEGHRDMALEILSCARNPECFQLVIILMQRYLFDSNDDPDLQFEAIAALGEVPSNIARPLFQDKVTSIASSPSKISSAARAAISDWKG